MTPTTKHVLQLAGLAALWGGVKAYAYHRMHPSCEDHDSDSLGRHLYVTVGGPLTEELTGREILMGHFGVGLIPQAVYFGLGHFSPKAPLSPVGHALRVADATLGGVLYGLAWKAGGTGASTFVHASHNLAASVGSAASSHP